MGRVGGRFNFLTYTGTEDFDFARHPRASFVYDSATMYRMDWTDDRLQERFDSIDRRFDEVDRRLDQVDLRFEKSTMS